MVETFGESSNVRNNDYAHVSPLDCSGKNEFRIDARSLEVKVESQKGLESKRFRKLNMFLRIPFLL